MKEQANKIHEELMTLKNWHLKMLILAGIITPSITATGAYFGIKEKIQSEKSEMSERVSKLELETTKTFADKSSVEEIDRRTQRMENDITEIKTILKTKLR